MHSIRQWSVEESPHVWIQGDNALRIWGRANTFFAISTSTYMEFANAFCGAVGRAQGSRAQEQTFWNPIFWNQSFGIEG